MTEKELPRERLFNIGSRNISVQELISIILGVGTRKKSVFQLSQEIEQVFKSVGTTDIDTLLHSIPDLGKTQHARILASLELGRRFANKRRESDPFKISTPAAAMRYLHPTMCGLKEEQFFVVLVNVKNAPIRLERIAHGNESSVFFLVRDVFTAAVRWKASGILCSHNHPSGDPTPSAEDRLLNDKIKASAQLLGVRFLDHLVFCDEKAFSLESERIVTCS